MDAAVHASTATLTCEHCQVRVIAGAVFCASDCSCETCAEEARLDAVARAIEDEQQLASNAESCWTDADERAACGVTWVR